MATCWPRLVDLRPMLSNLGQRRLETGPNFGLNCPQVPAGGRQGGTPPTNASLKQFASLCGNFAVYDWLRRARRFSICCTCFRGSMLLGSWRADLCHTTWYHRVWYHISLCSVMCGSTAKGSNSWGEFSLPPRGFAPNERAESQDGRVPPEGLVTLPETQDPWTGRRPRRTETFGNAKVTRDSARPAGRCRNGRLGVPVCGSTWPRIAAALQHA